MSVLKVVATMLTPTSHHGAERPEVKNSLVLPPARRARTSAGTNETTIERTTTTQSSVEGFMRRSGGARRVGRWPGGAASVVTWRSC
ncbi:MAG: hypothetical protein MUF40_06820 [Gemmatimonadaceae bacterium]|nr:hypothetical protein [Gemmatimonadaceae bacterium]